MVDRLAYYCPEIGIDEEYIADTLKEILRVENITVNDEWAGYYFESFRSTNREVPNLQLACHTRHPLATLMNGKEVTFKGAKKTYAALCRPAAPSQEVSFDATSHYVRMAKAILEGKLT